MTGFPLKSFRCRKRGRHMMEKVSILRLVRKLETHQREDQKLLFKAEYAAASYLTHRLLTVSALTET